MSAPAPTAVSAALAALGPLGRTDVPLGPLTTYRVGGPATVAVTITCRADVARVADAVSTSGLAVLVVGRGSNLLVADAGFEGIAVIVPGSAGQVADASPVGVRSGATVSGRAPAAPSDLLSFSVEPGSSGPSGGTASRSGSAAGSESAEVLAGAGVPLPTLARRSADAGLRGLEWAVGVPGSVGGGVRMNAGGHGADMADSVLSVTVADLTLPPAAADAPVLRTMTLDDLAYGYRSSSIRTTDLVLAARLRATPGDADEARGIIRDIVAWRREHQPGGQNAGSVFTNPSGDAAGRLIDVAGQKGRRWGSAMVSTKHANFIQADPGGSADDVRALIDLVRDAVDVATGVELHTEVRMIGFR